MHRRGPFSISLFLFVSLLIGHIPSHMVSSSDFSDDESNSEDEEIFLLEEHRSDCTDEISESSNAGTESIDPDSTKDNDQPPVTIKSGTGDTEPGYKEIISQGSSLLYIDFNGDPGSLSIYEGFNSNFHNKTSFHTNGITYEYELQGVFLVVFLISARFGCLKITWIWCTIKSKGQSECNSGQNRPLYNEDSKSRSYKESEKFKNARNTHSNEFGMLKDKVKSYSGGLKVQTKRVYLLLRVESSTETSSSPNRPRSLNKTPVEISKRDLPNYLKDYKINEVVILEDYHSGNIHRLSPADISESDIISRTIPGTGSTKVTVQKINTTSHEGSERWRISDNTNKGGNEGEAVVISFEITKTDIDENIINDQLMELKSKVSKIFFFKSKGNSHKRHNSEDSQGKSSDDTFDKDSFTGTCNSSPMNSFVKGTFGTFNVGTNTSQFQTMHINLRSYRKFPRGFMINDEVNREFLASTLNILRRKRILRDQFSVPPNVIDPFNASFELSTEDFRREFEHKFKRPMSSEWSQFFNASMTNYLFRYASFSDWPIAAPFSATRLVTAGFFYDSQKRAIYCFNCGIEVNCTGGQLEMFAKQRISPIHFHLSLNPRCEYALSEMQRNEKVDAPNITTTSEDNVSAIMNDLCVTDQKTSAAPGSVPGMMADIGRKMEIPVVRRDILPDNIASYSGVVNSDNNIPENRQGRHDHHSSYSSHDSPSGRTNVVHNGVFEYNYPVKSPAYKDIYSRLESYRGWPIKNIQDPKELVNAGFFYTNKKDIVRCFSCDIGLAEWDKDDDPWLEHARHSPDCKYIKEKQGQEFIDSVQSDWQKIYKPKHPAYNALKTRLDSFTGWPEELTQKPDVLAAAGFFYTGEGDVARCHYCDGGLREWEPGDDPWAEHARWFPYCKYLIKLKGLEYVEQIARQSESRHHGQASGQSNQVNGFSDDSILTNHPSTSQQQIQNEREEPMVTAAAETLLVMGYKRYEIQYVINRFIANHGNRHFNAENLLDIIMDMEDRGETIPEILEYHSITNGISNEAIEPHLVQLENQRLKAQMLCVTCKKMDRRMLLVPCGHRLHCESCSKSVKRCPNCKKKVNKIVKTFLS